MWYTGNPNISCSVKSLCFYSPSEDYLALADILAPVLAGAGVGSPGAAYYIQELAPDMSMTGMPPSLCPCFFLLSVNYTYLEFPICGTHPALFWRNAPL